MAVAAAKPGTRTAGVETPESSMTRRAVNVGLIGGAASLYLCFVGIVPRFEDREVITEVINLGRTMLVLVFLATGYFAARPPKVRHGEPEPPAPPAGTGLMAGALAGAICGAMTAALLIVANAIDMRSVFVAVGPVLVDILAFGQDAGLGAVILIAFSTALAVVAAGIHLLPPNFRKALLTGLATLLFFSLFSTLIGDLLEGTSEYIPLALFDDTSWLYEGDGVTIIGTILILVIVTAVAGYRERSGGLIKPRIEALPPERQARAKLVMFVLIAIFLLILPQIAGRFVSDVLGTIGIYILLGLGLNIVVGFAGLLDLGYVAFFAIGAYGTAMFTSEAAFTEGVFNFWYAVPVVMVITTALGVLIGAPVLRLRGDYLAIVTLGFGEIVRVLVISEWLRPWTGGAQGILAIPDPDVGVTLPLVGGPELGDPQSLYYLILIFCLAAAFVAYRLQDSRVGRAWVAMREDEQVAEAMGISIIKTKLLAFAMGAAIGSFGGMFFAVKIGSVFPNSMVLLVSIVVLALIVLGGMGSIPGVIVGSLVLVGLPEILREFVEYRLLVYGGVLVAIMIFRPEGLIPSARRRLELHEEEAEELQFELRHGEDVAEAAPVVTAGAGDETR